MTRPGNDLFGFRKFRIRQTYELPGRLGGILKPARRLFGQHPRQPFLESLREMLPRHRGRILVNLTAQHLRARGMGKNAAPRRKQIGHTAQRIQIRPRPLVARLVENLFRRHVSRRPSHHPVRQILCPHRLGYPEIRQHRARNALLLHQKDVAGLDVPVNHVTRMGVRQRVEQLQQQIAHLKPRKRRFRLGKRPPRRQLHRIKLTPARDFTPRCLEQRLVRRAIVQQPDDRRMMQFRHGPHFVGKRLLKRLVLRPDLRQHLDRHRYGLHPMHTFPYHPHRPLSYRAYQIKGTK